MKQGFIHWQEGPLPREKRVFETPTSFLKAALGVLDPADKTQNGWTHVWVDGVSLDTLRKTARAEQGFV
jgi:hypothetical protein